MGSFRKTGYTTTEIAPASQAELNRQSQYNAFAFGGEAMGGGASIAEIAQILRRQGRLRALTPAETALIDRATYGGLARGFAPQIDAATDQISNSLAARGVRGSTGSLFAGAAAPIAGALGEAQRTNAAMQFNAPFQFQQAGINQANAMGNLVNMQANYAQFSLQRDLSERSQNTKTSVYKRKTGFFSRIAGALGGALLGAVTGGVGTAIAGAAGGLFGGGGGGTGEAPAGTAPTGVGQPATTGYFAYPGATPYGPPSP